MAPSVPPIGPTRYRTVRPRLGPIACTVAALALTVGCSAGETATESLTAPTPPEERAAAVNQRAAGAEPVPPEPTTAAGAPASSTEPEAVAPEAVAPPAWLGRRTLPTSPDGAVVPQTTPEELRERRLGTVDRLDPPTGDGFRSTIEPVDDSVLARSTWAPGCPVEPVDLSYLTMSFWGFDGRPHTGEMIVHREVASDIVGVFERLFEIGFPVEEMRVVSPADLDAPPTGDGNNTTAFVCRPVTGGTRYSEHAFGLAVDINPFHNPYRRETLVLPELAGHYLDRSLDQPGMIAAGDPVVEAFAAIGWSWGGNWRSLEDYQHFSLNGR